MATAKRSASKTTRTTARKRTTTVVPKLKTSDDDFPIYNEPVTAQKECCDDCGKCENCLHPAGNIRNYTPLLILLLLISSFLLGMLLTKIGAFQGGDNLSQYTSGSTSGTTPGAQTAGGAVKPLHVAQAIGMDADAFKKCLDSGKYTQAVANDLADGQKAGVTGTPAIFINGLSIVGAEPYSVFKQTIDQELATARSNDTIFQKLANAMVAPVFAQAQTDTTTPTEAATSPTPPVRVTVDPGKFPALGNDSAKVKVIEFADFQCPFCHQFYTDVEKNLINDYVKSGKVQYFFRNYAFLGAESNVSAEGAYCANDQGKFWAYHNFLYEHQGQENSGQFTKANLE